MLTRKTHRLVVNLNDGYRDEFGGHFIMFNDPPSLENIYQVLRPIHNTAVGFAACRHSFHAVNRVSNWERYSLIFSFWEKKKRRAQTFNIIDYEKTGLAKYLQFLISHHADEVSHSDAGLLSHLIDTYRILKSWKCSQALCKAGLFHSIYGTQQFTTSLLGLDQRNEVRKLIGKTAEQIAYLFCFCEKESLYNNIIRGQEPYWVANKHDGSKIHVSKEDLKNLITLDAANSLEQIERVEMPMEALKAERDIYLQAVPSCRKQPCRQFKKHTVRYINARSRMDDSLLMSKKVFPTPEQAEEFLTKIFKDKCYDLLWENKHDFFYKISWPVVSCNHADPVLEENLRTHFNLSFSGIPCYYKTEKWGRSLQYIESFHHHWALLAWSAWLKKQTAQGRSIDPLILHVDAHDDLQCPAVYFSKPPSCYTDLFGNACLDLFDPASLKPYLLRGLVGIGGFIQLFLHTVKTFTLQHVFNTFLPDGKEYFEQRHIGLVRNKFSCNKKSFEYPGIVYTTEEPLNYSLSSNPYFLDADANKKILLDIDMDYFNNQYDHFTKAEEHHPSGQELKDRIDLFIDYIKQLPLQNIETISIALSPNFFPSSEWKQFFI